MGKIIKSFLLVLGLSILTVSCTKDGDSSNYSRLIVGTWQFDVAKFYNNNTIVETYSSKDMELEGIVIILIIINLLVKLIKKRLIILFTILKTTITIIGDIFIITKVIKNL